MPTLNWIGKDAVLNHHREVPYRLLKCEGDLSHGDPGSGNLLVEGDNLEALKALLPYYKGRVKCIYIDPPYNTGEEDWSYNDNVNSPQMRKWLGQVVGKEDLDRHDRWLCMIWPRLCLLKEFLRQDGAIFISIDENEIAHLRMLLDAIFGAKNLIAEMIWEKSRKNDARFISVGHEYVVVYARNKGRLVEDDVKWREYKVGTREIQRRYLRARQVAGEDDRAVEALLGRYYTTRKKGHPSKALSRYRRVDRLGVWRDDNVGWPTPDGPRYDVPHPETGLPCVVPPNGWRWSTYEKFLEAFEKGRVEFRADHAETPQRKTYLIKESSALDEDDEEVGVQVRGSYFYRSLQPAAKTLRTLFGKTVFNNPKDHLEIARLVGLVADGNHLVLDSFAVRGPQATPWLP